MTSNQEIQRTNPDFAASYFISAILTNQATKLISHITALRQVKNFETIHDCRIAIRTINSHLDTFSPFLRRKATNTVMQQLDWLNAKFATIRELDAMIALVVKVENKQVKQSLITRLQGQRLHQEIKLQKMLDSPKLDLVLKSLTNFALNAPVRRKFSELSAKKTQAKVTATISHTWVLLFECLDELPKRPNTKQLHRLRIAAKQCRYAYEAAAETNLLQSPHILAWTKQLQKDLGQVQDIKILCKWIKNQSDLESLVRTQALIYFSHNLPNRKQLLVGVTQISK